MVELSAQERIILAIDTSATEDAERFAGLAQAEAGDIIMLGVTELTSIPPEETQARYGISRSVLVNRLARDAAAAGLKGIVASPKEVLEIKFSTPTQDLFAMIPGVRPAGAEVNDQANVGTPGATIRNGADLLVIGRPILKAEDPMRAYKDIAAEIEGAINERA